MKSLSVTNPNHFMVFLRGLPTIAVAGLAGIAIQHSPTVDLSRTILSAIVAAAIILNGLCGPRLWSAFVDTDSNSNLR
ncbi:hypothetical protein K239x_29970 [Planctomycetes bacterium K23_9]|uniref:Uncharacterized protein n=1 Tax=Stieleria marina TaxID=1930275 RepID=A0A517NV52_9BACT|nr:hypothetical protein K239x_29970 [Planctomycetes bacterium K23_9]